MNNYLYIIPLLPLIGFLILSLLGKFLNKPIIAIIGAGSVTIAAIVVIALALSFNPESTVRQTLWQ